MRSLLILASCASVASAQLGNWPQHSMDRPQPPVIDPGPFTASLRPPSDAVVLFDGTSLDHWTPAKWKVVNGYMEVVPGTGSIETKETFGDVQLHVEWATPTPPKGESQERGNSGVFLMGKYEVQVLDSYHNKTYPDGQAGAIYGQYPPLVNASRPPGQWQSYDIVFRRPHFDAQGNIERPARMTVFHNGVLVQDDQPLVGPTTHAERAPYTAHPDKLPLSLQDHGNRVRYRNIWIREIAEPK